MKPLKTILLLIIILANIGCETKRHHATQTRSHELISQNKIIGSIQTPSDYKKRSNDMFISGKDIINETLLLNLGGYNTIVRIWKTKQKSKDQANQKPDTIESILEYKKDQDPDFEKTKKELLKLLTIENEVTDSTLELYKNNGLTWLQLNTTMKENKKNKYFLHINKSTNDIYWVVFTITNDDFSDIDNIMKSILFN
jgi:hypothetical protein